jgi:hypothetical protein
VHRRGLALHSAILLHSEDLLKSAFPLIKIWQILSITIMILHQLFLLSLASAQAPVVNLSYSSYEGSSLLNGVSQFLGLRYAAAPVGDLRFEAPQDPPFKSDTQKAKRVRAHKDYVEKAPPC